MDQSSDTLGEHFEKWFEEKFGHMSATKTIKSVAREAWQASAREPQIDAVIDAMQEEWRKDGQHDFAEVVVKLLESLRHRLSSAREAQPALGDESQCSVCDGLIVWGHNEEWEHVSTHMSDHRVVARVGCAREAVQPGAKGEI